MLSIQVLQAGLLDSPAAQYSVAAAYTIQALCDRATMAHGSTSRLIPWQAAQATTQRRCDPPRRTAQGAASCKTAPKRTGTVATSPAATPPMPSASANAGK